MIPIQIAEKQPQLNKNKSVALSNVYLLKEIEKKSPKTKIDTSLHQGTMHRKVWWDWLRVASLVPRSSHFPVNNC